jgi:predicted alpha/beta-hydrolase family hydrolase
VIHYPAAGKADVHGPPCVVVLAHGAGAGQRHPFMVKVARALADRGIDVVTFDFPYMQQKRKAPDKAPVLEDAFRRAIAEARALVSPGHALFVGGKSMGGRIATHLAAAPVGATLQGGPIRGVIALGYPLHPPGKPEQPRTAHLPSITVPVLIVQGERDAFGTPEELRPVIRTITAPVTLHVIDGGDHSLAVRRATDYAAIAEILAAWIHDV